MTTPPPGPVGDLELWLSSDEPDRAAICLCFSDSPGGAAPPLDPSRVTSLLDLAPARTGARGRPLHFWNCECDIPASLVEAVAARHLALHFDIYYPQGEPGTEVVEDVDDRR